MTPTSQQLPHDLLHQWGIDGATIQLLRESENLVYLVEHGLGIKRILRIGRKRFADDIHFELSTLKGIRSNGILAPKVCPTLRGNWFRESNDGTMAVVFEYLDGNHPRISGTSLDKISPPPIKMVQEAGKGLAELHLVTEKLCTVLPLESKRSIFSEVEAIRGLKKEFCNFTEGAEKFLDRLELLAQQFSTTILPIGVIHNDFRPHNLLFNERNELSGILDFDWACRGPLIKDLALAAAEWSFADGADAPFKGYFEIFVRAYEQVRPLSTEERASFPAMLEFTLLAEAATFFRKCIPCKFEWGKKVQSSYMYRKAAYFSQFLGKKEPSLETSPI